MLADTHFCPGAAPGGSQGPLKLARFVSAPENRSALMALEHLANCLCSELHQRLASPVFIHGPPGAGKTHLALGLAEEIGRRAPHLVVTIHSASEFEEA